MTDRGTTVIVPLTRDTAEDIERLGGKGCGLVRLIRAGLPVPQAWCVPARRAPSMGKSGLASRALEEQLRSFWGELASREPGVRLAVRSSATAEDLEDASFAGIYQTRLDVSSADELVRAVRECRGALHARHAAAYREGRGPRGRRGKRLAMAIVIQRMLAPEVAGVMLTANPMRPFAPEIVIDAAWGLGEAVVSGRCQPDHLVLDRATGTVRQAAVGGKEVEIVFIPGRGHVARRVPSARRRRLCLSGEQIGALAALARRIEEAIGPRQDLEWAFARGQLFVLQQRPITGLPPERPANVWSRKFGDEYLADYTMPLSYTLLARWITDDFLREMALMWGSRSLAEMEPIRRYHGYAFVSGEYLARMLRALPRRLRDPEALGWFTPIWNERIRAEPFDARLLLGALIAPFRDPRAPLWKNPRALATHCASIEKRVVPLLARDYTALTTDQWRRQFDEACEIGREHFRVIRWGMGFHNPGLHAALERALGAWAGDKSAALYQAIVSGLPGTRTAEINRDIWRLGLLARTDSGLRRALAAGEPCTELRARFAASPFWAAFDEFLARHGHRAATREIARPRWCETPEVVLGLVRAQLHGGEPPDPARAERAAAERRLAAEREALARAGGPAGPARIARRALLRWLFRWTQTYTLYRENQRYHLDYLLLHIRRLILEQGRRLTAAGVLDEPFEIFFLEAGELWPLVERPIRDRSLRRRIEERRQDYLLWKDRLPAPYLFDDVETEGEVPDEDSPAEQGGPRLQTAVRGLGASRGVARGKARVVTDLAHLDRIHPGEILVTANTDPGWTSVFPLLAGLVTETGGMLSHGALLAREYGIPAVTGVRGVTRRIRTGDDLEVDGTGGILRILGGGSRRAAPSRLGSHETPPSTQPAARSRRGRGPA